MIRVSQPRRLPRQNTRIRDSPSTSPQNIRLRIVRAPLALALASVLAQTAYAAPDPLPESEEPVAAAGATVLDSVVVTASGFEQVVREAPASISIITREDLE